MNQQFSNAQIYAPIYPPNHQHSAPSSRPQSHGAPQRQLPLTHTLPPLPSANHAVPAFGSDNYPTRSQPLQPSLMTAPQEQVSQTAPYPVYAPTANTFYNGGHSANFSHASQQNQQLHNQQLHNQQLQNQQLHQQQESTSVNGITPPVFASLRLPELLPMPPGANGKPSLPIGNHLGHLDTPEEPQPTHVVGSQGRRGILPSAAGRPAAVAGASTSGQKAAPTPPKDAEGKYPCPHCTKNYLHAKHLKRHLLRHTGVRPYTCGLCKDTFSRSDILKRHFQKCSVRRGNPSGENHLSHSRANKKTRQEDAARMESSTPTDVNQPQQIEAYTPTSLDGSFEFNTLTLGQTPYMETANQISRSNSVKKSKRSTESHSNRASLGLVSSSGYEPANYGYISGHVTPDSATTSGAATPYTHQFESRSNQISPSGAYSAVNGRDMGFGGVGRASTSLNYNHGLPHIAGQRGGHELDWPSFSNFHSSDDYGNAQYHSGTNTPLHPIKSEGDLASLPIGDYSYLHSKA